jgi:hypothetical protein
MTSAPQYNLFDALCAPGSCLDHVVGRLGNDAAAQYAGCRAAFGLPAVPTVTLPAEEDVFATETSTATVTEIVVATSTAYSTLEAILTSYTSVFETATEYTTTVVNTLTTQPAAVVTPTITVVKRSRRACTPKAPATTSSAAAAPVCADLAEYSSACACLVPKTTATEYLPATTSLVRETHAATVSHTSEAVVTVAVTTVVVRPATTTLTSTLTTLTATTTTTTPSATPQSTFTLNAINIFSFVASPLVASADDTAGGITLGPAGTNQSPSALGMPTAGGVMYLAASPDKTMFVAIGGTAAQTVRFGTREQLAPAPAGTTYSAVACARTGVLVACSAGNYNKIYLCGGVLSMAPSGVGTGCAEVRLQVSNV